MSETSRRNFIAATGAGAAAGAVALTTGAAASVARPRPDAAKDRVVAVVENHRSSELRLLVGEREIVVHDRDLVNRILNAAGGQ
ncbi:MAG: twin-arginine translocation signal protein [Nocardioides sp.]|nr:twin-arginine translocation signal protein [Nocardioides sp.]